MKDDIHPDYREVVFHDLSSGDKFLVGSTVETDQTTTIDGEEYPLQEVEISSSSHPFYTGEQKLVDTEGRVEKFRRKYGGGEEDEENAEEEEE